jgi:hypothetical protein
MDEGGLGIDTAFSDNIASQYGKAVLYHSSSYPSVSPIVNVSVEFYVVGVLCVSVG